MGGARLPATECIECWYYLSLVGYSATADKEYCFFLNETCWQSGEEEMLYTSFGIEYHKMQVALQTVLNLQAWETVPFRLI